MSKVVNMVGGGSSGTPRKYLVKDGVAVNGNLVALAMKSSSTSSLASLEPTLSYGSGNVTLGFLATGSAGAGIVYLDSAIDLTQYNTLFARGTFILYSTSSFSSNNLAVDAWANIGTYQVDNRLFQYSVLGITRENNLQTSQLATFEFDVTSFSNSALIGFNFGRTTSGYGKVILTDVWLE